MTSPDAQHAITSLQHAATAALNDMRHAIAPMIETYQRRSEFMIDALSKIKEGIEVMPTQSTFYVFADIKGLLAN